MDLLSSDSKTFQKKIELSLERNQSQPVGTGYIDIITDTGKIDNLITELTEIGIAINGVTWWCYCSEENKEKSGCPHGMGGPKSIYKVGWYSEMGLDYECFNISQNVYDKFESSEVTFKEIKSLNESVRKYIYDFSQDEKSFNCLTPALWLHVPREWKRTRYLKY
jgi:hypothetical protein